MWPLQWKAMNVVAVRVGSNDGVEIEGDVIRGIVGL